MKLFYNAERRSNANIDCEFVQDLKKFRIKVNMKKRFASISAALRALEFSSARDALGSRFAIAKNRANLQ